MTGPAQIGEIFNSIQGEGIFTGVRQIFVRFQGCLLNCGYCDTLQFKSSTSEICKVESGPIEFQDISNPLDVDDLVEIIHNLWSPATRHLSLTGGEPLLHSDFIDTLSRCVDYPLYLETNGSLPDEARKVKYVVDMAACDIKLPEHNASEDYQSLLKAELETVGIFYEAGAVTFVKSVVTDRTLANTIETIAHSLSDLDDTIPFILQPVTPCHGFEPPSPARLLERMDVAGEYLMDVRAIPQVHKMMGQL
jgi:7-carboxy-7-deazaguanine synthase